MRLCAQLMRYGVGAVKSLDGTGVLAGISVNGVLDARQPRCHGGCSLGVGQGSKLIGRILRHFPLQVSIGALVEQTHLFGEMALV